MSTPIRLADDELEAVMNACRPLHPRARDVFLRQVAEAIAALPERGPGSVHRAIAEAPLIDAEILFRQPQPPQFTGFGRCIEIP